MKTFSSPTLIIMFCVFLLLSFQKMFGQQEQSFDIEIASALSSRTLDISKAEKEDLLYRENEKVIINYSLALAYNKKISRNLYLKTGMDLFMSGYSVVPFSMGWPNFRLIKHRHIFLGVPVNLRYELNDKKWIPYVELGLLPSYYLTTYKSTYDYYGPEEHHSFYKFENFFNYFQIGGCLSLGMNYQLSKSSQVYLQSGFLWHFSRLKNYYIRQHFYSFGLDLGTRFKF